MNQRKQVTKYTAIVFASLTLSIAGCSQSSSESQTITLASTTSTRDSGLLDQLVPMFKEETGIEVKVVAVGSGQAIELGRRGDADVLLTHAPDAEQELMDQRHGAKRMPVMHNDFVIVGPPDHPGGAKDKSTVVEAFQQISKNQSSFVSRGDESGTHMKEKEIWKTGGLEPKGEWYIRAGAGMSAALRMASEKQAYTLSDRGTFLAQRESLDLAIVFEGDSLLHNPYTVIVISHEKHPGVNHKAAAKFAEFLVTPKVQAVIGKFGVEKYGQPLFFARKPAGEGG